MVVELKLTDGSPLAKGRSLKRLVESGPAKLRRVNLEGATLPGVDLCRANLMEANLCEVNFRRANLSGARFYKANMNRADLSRARLVGADLYGVNLTDACLNRAIMKWANFEAADLFRADLIGANLAGASLKAANLTNADLTDTNLEGADIRWACLRNCKINWNSHDLVAEILRSAADDVASTIAGRQIARLKFAGLPLVNRTRCWAWFSMMLHEDPEWEWAMSVLRKFVKIGDSAPSCIATPSSPSDPDKLFRISYARKWTGPPKGSQETPKEACLAAIDPATPRTPDPS